MYKEINYTNRLIVQSAREKKEGKNMGTFHSPGRMEGRRAVLLTMFVTGGT